MTLGEQQSRRWRHGGWRQCGRADGKQGEKQANDWPQGLASISAVSRHALP
jgi:hypothetical protein